MRPFLTTFLVALVGALGASPASAHPGHRRSARLIRLDLSVDPPKLGYALIFDPAAAAAARKLADRNGDGTLSGVERDAELERLTKELCEKLTICSGPALDQIQCSAAKPDQVTGLMATGWEPSPNIPLAISWQVRLDLAARDAALRIDDGWLRSEVDRNDALIELAESMRLTAAGPGNGALHGITREFTWPDGPPERPRTLFAVWEPPSSRGLVIGVLGAAGFAGLLAVGPLVVARVRKRRNTAHA